MVCLLQLVVVLKNVFFFLCRHISQLTVTANLELRTKLPDGLLELEMTDRLKKKKIKNIKKRRDCKKHYYTLHYLDITNY